MPKIKQITISKADKRIQQLNDIVLQYSTEISALEKKILELQYEKEKIEAEIKRLSNKHIKHV